MSLLFCRISNLGMFGITEFSAIINPPQSGILAVGGSQLVIGADGRPQTMMTVTLSADTRTIDNVLAAQFLEVFRQCIESPMLMLEQHVSTKGMNFNSTMLSNV